MKWFQEDTKLEEAIKEGAVYMKNIEASDVISLKIFLRRHLIEKGYGWDISDEAARKLMRT